MRSRQDQLHAHQYSQQRVVAALVRHDPDPSHSPLPRPGMQALVGLLITAVLLVGVVIVANLTGRGGSVELRDDSAVFVERETGAQFVYTKSDDRLHPVLNYVSGLLIANAASPRAVNVRRAALAQRQRDTKLALGGTLGIPDAPKTLPASADLVHGGWQLCTEPGPAGRPQSRLIIGTATVDGHPLGAPATGTAGDALLVAEPGGTQYLIYAGHKFLIRKRAAVLVALGWTGRKPYTVAAAWLNTLPAGPDVEPPHLERIGAESAVPGDRIGQLYRAPGPNNTTQWAVARRDGVQPVTDVQARLLDADPSTKVGTPIDLDTARFGALPTTPPSSEPGQELLPATVPTLVGVAQSVCLTVADAASTVTRILVDPVVATSGVNDTAGTAAGRGGAPAADHVYVPYGRGALVEAASSPTAPAGSGTLTLVTDGGWRYAIADRNALGRLGYGLAVPQRMPAGLVALLPQGPALSTPDALKPRP